MVTLFFSCLIPRPIAKGATMSIGLHPTAIISACHQSLADRVGLFAGTGRKQNKAMPDAFLAHVDGLRLNLSVPQLGWKPVLQLDKGAIDYRLLLVGEQHRHESIGSIRWRHYRSYHGSFRRWLRFGRQRGDDWIVAGFRCSDNARSASRGYGSGKRDA